MNWEEKPLKERYLTTYPSLGKFYPWDPKPEQIQVEDVAQALSQTCRYNGLLPWLYSVAQHSIIVSQIVDREFAFEALMHDAAEYVLQDLTRPVKMGLGDYKALEKTVEPVIAVKFGLCYPCPPEVKVADKLLMRYEILFFYGRDRYREDFGEEPPWDIDTVAWDFRDAKKPFYNRQRVAHALREQKARDVRDEFLDLFHRYHGRH